MRRGCGVLLLLAGVAAIASAADREFADIVREISAEYHTRPVHIPLFGLVKTVVFVARPAGTKQMDLAVFENLQIEGHDGAALSRRIVQIAGATWKPFVRVRSSRAGHTETTLIFMRPDRSDAHLLIATLEPSEATIIHLKVNPDALRRWMDHPTGEALNVRSVAEDSQP